MHQRNPFHQGSYDSADNAAVRVPSLNARPPVLSRDPDDDGDDFDGNLPDSSFGVGEPGLDDDDFSDDDNARGAMPSPSPPRNDNNFSPKSPSKRSSPAVAPPSRGPLSTAAKRAAAAKKSAAKAKSAAPDDNSFDSGSPADNNNHSGTAHTATGSFPTPRSRSKPTSGLALYLGPLWGVFWHKPLMNSTRSQLRAPETVVNMLNFVMMMTLLGAVFYYFNAPSSTTRFFGLGLWTGEYLLRRALEQGTLSPRIVVNLLCGVMATWAMARFVFHGCMNQIHFFNPFAFLHLIPLIAAICDGEGLCMVWGVVVTVCAVVLYATRHSMLCSSGPYQAFSLDEAAAVNTGVFVMTLACFLFLVRIFVRRLDEANHARLKWMSTMSHDVRTPLHGVLNSLEEALECDVPSNVRTHLETIHSCVRVLLLVLNNTLFFARSQEQPNSPTPGSVPVLLESFAMDARVLAQSVGKRHNIKVSIEPGSPKAVSGPTLSISDLFQCFNDIFSNAVKFTPPGGSIEIWCGVDKKERLLFVSVEDNGPGVPEGDRQRIFERGFTGALRQSIDAITRPRTLDDNHGLGLDVVHRIVTENLGGHIECMDRRDGKKGARFVISVPFGTMHDDQDLDNLVSNHTAEQEEFDSFALQGSPPVRTPAGVELGSGLELPAQAKSGDLRIKRGLRNLDNPILIVDDNALNLRILSSMLLRVGIPGDQILVFSRGSEAIAAARKQPLSVAFIDVFMPAPEGYADENDDEKRTMYGLDVCREIRSLPNQANCWKVAATASQVQETAQKCISAGFDVLLAKPFSKRQIEGMLDSIALGDRESLEKSDGRNWVM